MVKNCDLGHSFSPYGPPSRQITYISAFRSVLKLSAGNGACGDGAVFTSTCKAINRLGKQTAKLSILRFC